ncbi:MAG: MBL fold metallo-hydrolase [Vulcanimicrobiaceae bacterium]
MSQTSVHPRIEWVNHASFITSSDGVRLICDPWLEGTAFKDGWQLLAPTTLRYQDFEHITHLWLSHQHPDHFAPTNLSMIPPEIRKRITVLYKQTPDKLVTSWCRTRGFGCVVELEPDRWIELAPEFHVMCGNVCEDSWLAMRTPKATLLNVNDCVLNSSDRIEQIAASVGHVDVLFTQFSYAQWAGNPCEYERRRREAREKLDRIRLQDRILNPRAIVPFASYFYFCHEENFYLNDFLSEPADVARFIERDLKKTAVVLYPGDHWRTDEVHCWYSGAARYSASRRVRLACGPTHGTSPSNAATFEAQIRAFFERLKVKNAPSRIFVREHATVFLTDLLRAYEFSAGGIRPCAKTAETADIATASENVLYAFRTPWGGNTLHANGRFTSYVDGGHLRFFRLMRQLHHYNVTPVTVAWLHREWKRLARGARNRLRRFVHGGKIDYAKTVRPG